MATFRALASLKFKPRWLIFTALALGFAFPDPMIQLLEGTFELVEFLLDQLIEHWFHTDRHTTQLVVFYLLILISVLVGYLVFLNFPAWYRKWEEDWLLSRSQLKQMIESKRPSLSPLNKMLTFIGLMIVLSFVIWTL